MLANQLIKPSGIAEDVYIAKYDVSWWRRRYVVWIRHRGDGNRDFKCWTYSGLIRLARRL